VAYRRWTGTACRCVSVPLVRYLITSGSPLWIPYSYARSLVTNDYYVIEKCESALLVRLDL